MNIRVDYINKEGGIDLRLGDTVKILKYTNDSGDATDLYGVDPHLGGWVENVYIEDFEGVVTYDTSSMMIVLQGKFHKIPLASMVRLHLWMDLHERLDKDDANIYQKEFGLNLDEDGKLILGEVLDYIEVIK